MEDKIIQIESENGEYIYEVKAKRKKSEPDACDAMMAINSIKELVEGYKETIKEHVRRTDPSLSIRMYNEGMLAGLDMVSIWIEELTNGEKEKE